MRLYSNSYASVLKRLSPQWYMQRRNSFIGMSGSALIAAFTISVPISFSICVGLFFGFAVLGFVSHLQLAKSVPLALNVLRIQRLNVQAARQRQRQIEIRRAESERGKLRPTFGEPGGTPSGGTMYGARGEDLGFQTD
jgi:hypothetical protein